jgi:polysaccharide pyruvyl transferase WcaK-like protein
LIALSWSIDNIGSMAITPGLLQLVKQTNPDIPVQVFSLLEEGTADFPISRDYIPRFKSNCTVHPNIFRPMFQESDPSSRAWLDFIQRHSAHRLESFRKGCLASEEAEAIADDLLHRLPLEIVDEMRRDRPECAAAFEQAGFFIYNSGTMINFGRLGIRNMWGYTLPNVLPLLIARALKLPYGINANSFDAIDWPANLIYRPLLADAQFTYCRDTDSLNYLRQCGLLNQNSGYRPDSAFFFPGLDESWAEKYLANNGLQDKRFLTVIVRISGDQKALAYDPTGGSMRPERQAEHMRKLKGTIERWIADTGMKVLIAHEQRDTLHSAKQQLWDILSEDTRKHCVYLDEFWSSEQACSVLRRTRILLSMEMHSIILSLAHGTPVVHNPFDEAGRKKRMVRDLGFGDWLIDIDGVTTDEMHAAVMGIHNDYDSARQRLQEALPGIQARGRQMVSEVWTHWKRE